MDWSLWWLFPVAIVIAAVANGAGSSAGFRGSA